MSEFGCRAWRKIAFKPVYSRTVWVRLEKLYKVRKLHAQSNDLNVRPVLVSVASRPVVW